MGVYQRISWQYHLSVYSDELAGMHDNRQVGTEAQMTGRVSLRF